MSKFVEAIMRCGEVGSMVVAGLGVIAMARGACESIQPLLSAQTTEWINMYEVAGAASVLAGCVGTLILDNVRVGRRQSED